METIQHVFDEVSTVLPTIPGWCSQDKALKLVERILTHELDVCVEIGVFGGSSLIPQAIALKALGHGVVYGIDPWTTDAALEEMQDSANVDWWSSADLEKICQDCRARLTKLQLTSHCVLIREKAENVVDRFGDGTIKLLHIDGNHSEALSMKDTVMYLPKVAPGGFIFFDDISWVEGKIVTTHKALTYLLENNCTHVDRVGDCAILQNVATNVR